MDSETNNEIQPIEPQPATNPKGIQSLDALYEMTPDGWRDCKIGVCDALGGFEPILRVSFHENDDGRRVVLLHKDRVSRNLKEI